MASIRKITVLKGGWSPEREISLQSGDHISNLLRESGFEVYEIDVKKNLLYITQELYKSDPDYIYNTLHGIGGEDGVIQGILEVFGKPYSSSNVLSSAICLFVSILYVIAWKPHHWAGGGFLISFGDFDLFKNLFVFYSNFNYTYGLLFN